MAYVQINKYNSTHSPTLMCCITLLVGEKNETESNAHGATPMWVMVLDVYIYKNLLNTNCWHYFILSIQKCFNSV